MKKYKFEAKIKAGDGGGAYVLFPYDTKKEFATKGKVPVKVTFNGVLDKGSLIKYGNHSMCWVCLKPYASKLGKGRATALKSLFGKMTR